MKKLAAVLLLFIFSFNWVGYRLFVSFFGKETNTALETKLDANDFDETQLVSVKISASYFSGYVNEINFKRVNGQVDIKGVLYNYVKVRVYNDSLEMLCIPNENAMNLASAKDDFFKLVNDLQHKENRKSNAASSKNISTDYFAPNEFHIINQSFFASLKWPPCFASGIIFHASSVLENPPDIFC